MFQNQFKTRSGIQFAVINGTKFASWNIHYSTKLYPVLSYELQKLATLYFSLYVNSFQKFHALRIRLEVAAMHFISGKSGSRFHCYFSTSYSLKRTPLLPDLLLLKWVGNQQLRLPNLVPVRKDALMIPYCTISSVI